MTVINERHTVRQRSLPTYPGSAYSLDMYPQQSWLSTSCSPIARGSRKCVYSVVQRRGTCSIISYVVQSLVLCIRIFECQSHLHIEPRRHPLAPSAPECTARRRWDSRNGRGGGHGLERTHVALPVPPHKPRCVCAAGSRGRPILPPGLGPDGLEVSP